METEGCYDRTDGANHEASASYRSCSPAAQGEQQPSDVATEVTIHATPEPSVSSLICSGLQTIHGPERAWEENYCVEQHVTDPNTYDEEVVCQVPLQHDQVASQLQPYPSGPLPVVSHSNTINSLLNYIRYLLQNSSGPVSAYIPTSQNVPTPQNIPTAQNTNNSNSCAIVPAVDEGVGGLAMGAGCSEPPKKRSKIVKLNSAIEITLEGKNLWDEFCRRGTEMIVNRSGRYLLNSYHMYHNYYYYYVSLRRMFPGFSVAVTGLKPKVKYTMKLEVVLADNHRFKFLNARWLAVGTAEPQPLSESYIHPDSPNSGAFWMRHGISFRKLKITNNKERPGNNVS